MSALLLQTVKKRGLQSFVETSSGQTVNEPTRERREEKRRYTFLAGKRREEWTGRAGDGRGKKKKKDSEAHF